MIETTCRFCMHKLIDIGDKGTHDWQGYTTVSHTRRCNRCMVTQTFNPDGKPTCFSFEVYPYVLVFDLEANQFSIRKRADFSKLLMKSNYVPTNMTPKNTTLERVKLLILFS